MTATARLTLPDLLNFDPHSQANGGTRQRFCCPLCGIDKPRDMPHRSFDLDLTLEVYVCHRCGARGRLGSESNSPTPIKRPPPARSEACRKDWRAIVRESGLGPLEGSAGARYLANKRGIPVELAAAAGVKFAKRWFGSPAVMFPIRNIGSDIVAAQGRYIGDRKPHAMSAGPVKEGAFMTPGAWVDVVTLTEAPIDALSLLLMGRPAIATIGTNLQPWIAAACKGKTVFVATDADDAGDAAAKKWMDLLARHGAKAQRLRPPTGKDWNEIVQGMK